MSRATVVRHVPWLLATLSVAALAGAAAVGLTTDPALHVQRLTTDEYGWWIAYGIFCIVGGLVAARRPENRVAWLMLAAGAVNAFGQAAAQYGVWGLVRHPGSLPGASLGAWAMSFMWTPAIAVLVLVVAYFPNGRLVSRRWRWLPWTTFVCTTVIVVVTAVDMWDLRGPRLLSDNQDYELHTLAGHVISVLWPFVPVCAIAAMFSVAVRYRRTTGIERLQLKWLVVAAVVSGPMIPVAELVKAHSTAHVVVQLLNSPMWVAIAIVLAVLRYRLYDIDRIVSRTVSYALLSGLLVGVYVGCVAVLTSLLPFGSSVGVAVSTLAAAAMFQPLQRRVQRSVDRRFNRARYDAARTVDGFAVRLRDAVDPDVVRADLLDVAARAIQPASMSLWVAP